MPLEKDLEAAAEQVDQVHKLALELNDRLSPLLLPEAPTAPAEARAMSEQRPRSARSERAHALCRDLGGVAEALQATLDRLDL